MAGRDQIRGERGRSGQFCCDLLGEVVVNVVAEFCSITATFWRTSTDFECLFGFHLLRFRPVCARLRTNLGETGQLGAELCFVLGNLGRILATSGQTSAKLGQVRPSSAGFRLARTRPHVCRFGRNWTKSGQPIVGDVGPTRPDFGQIRPGVLVDFGPLLANLCNPR